MKNSNKRGSIDLSHRYVQDLGAYLPCEIPEVEPRPIWRDILVVVLVLLAAAVVGQVRMRLQQSCQVQMTVTLNNVTLEEGEVYSVRAGDVIVVTAESSEANIQRIGYRSNLNREIRDIYRDAISITVPEQETGTTVHLFIEAIADNDDGTANTITKTGWKEFVLQY